MPGWLPGTCRSPIIIDRRSNLDWSSYLKLVWAWKRYFSTKMRRSLCFDPLVAWMLSSQFMEEICYWIPYEILSTYLLLHLPLSQIRVSSLSVFPLSAPLCPFHISLSLEICNAVYHFSQLLATGCTGDNVCCSSLGSRYVLILTSTSVLTESGSLDSLFLMKIEITYWLIIEIVLLLIYKFHTFSSLYYFGIDAILRVHRAFSHYYL